MTIIYNKRTGTIKMAFSGNLQHISNVFGDEAEDYSQIYDEICLPDDNIIFRNIDSFHINIEKRSLELLDSSNLIKYV